MSEHDTAGMGVVSHTSPAVDLSMTVIDAVAEARSMDPLDLPPLGFVVDFDSLEAFVEAMRGRSIDIRFHVAECLVVVDDTHVHAYAGRSSRGHSG